MYFIGKIINITKILKILNFKFYLDNKYKYKKIKNCIIYIKDYRTEIIKVGILVLFFYESKYSKKNKIIKIIT